MQIERLDAADGVAMKAWHDTFLASHRHERPHATPLMLEELQARFLARHDATRHLPSAAWSTVSSQRSGCAT